MLTSIIAVALLQSASLPGTQPPQPAPPARRGAARAERSQTEQICRLEPVTGSRFPVRVCRTQRADAEIREDGREALRRVQGLRELPAT